MFRFLYFIISTLFFSQINGQDPSYLFVKTNPDLGNRAVTCMTTDLNNHMWIGTYGGGLKRYDGLNIETYSHDPFSESSISNSTIYDLVFNQNQGLWIATKMVLISLILTKKLFLYSTLYETISVHALCEANNNILVVGTHQKGVYFFNTITKVFDKIRIPESIDENGLLINDIIVDQLNRIWVGSNYGIFTVDKDLMMLTVSFSGQHNINPNNTALCFEIDHIGNIWIGTAEDGLFKILPGGVNNFDVEHYKISNKRIFSIKEYDNKHMLLGSENDGLFFVSFEGKVLKRLLKEKGNEFGIQSNSIWSILCDSKNRIWLGYYDQGLVKFDPNHFKFQFLQNNSDSNVRPFPLSISSIVKDNKDRIWFSSVDNGVYVYDTSNDEYIHLNDPKNKIAKGFNSLDITSLFIDSQQNIWVASWYNGLYVLRNGTTSFININTDSVPNKLMSNRVVSFSEDSSKVIWIGTFLGGLHSYDLKNGELTHYNDDQFIDLELDKANIRKIIVDAFDNVWLGTRKGLFRYNTKTKVVASINEKIESVIKNFGSNFVVFSIYEDTNNKIWIGTDGYGLLSYSPNEDKSLGMEKEKKLEKCLLTQSHKHMMGHFG